MLSDYAVQLTKSKICEEPLRLAVLDVITIDEWSYEITRINVPREHRGKGVGRALMAECLATADALGVTLCLGPRPYHAQGDPGLNLKQLTAWYKRVGFEPIGNLGLMQRQPKEQ